MNEVIDALNLRKCSDTFVGGVGTIFGRQVIATMFMICVLMHVCVCL